jgi:hypothetical protein
MTVNEREAFGAQEEERRRRHGNGEREEEGRLRSISERRRGDGMVTPRGERGRHGNGEEEANVLPYVDGSLI